MCSLLPKFISLAVVAACIGAAPAQGPSWSTYYGGSGDEGATLRGTVQLPNGNVVVVGATTSTNLQVPGALQPVYGGGPSDGFIACFDPTATGPAQCVWATYLGGSDLDEVTGVTVTVAGDILVCGLTNSPNLPTTPSCVQPTLAGGFDWFVARLSTATGGATLSFCTYLGGTGASERAAAIAEQSTGQIVVTGWSNGGFPSPTPPTPCPAYQSTLGGGLDAVVAIIDRTGSSLIASTYFGLGGNETPTCLALDNDRPVVGGVTSSGVTTTPSARQPAFVGGPNDGFVARFDPSLCVLQYSTHVGSGASDLLQAVAMTPGGEYAVGGWTGPGNPMFPTTNGSRYAGGPWDAFVATLDPTAVGMAQLPWSTLYGGGAADGVWDLAVDAAGRITVVGETGSSGLGSRALPTTAGAWQTAYGGGMGAASSDAWVARFDPLQRTSTRVLYCSFVGGAGNDRAFGLALDAQGDAIITGNTMSSNWPVTPGAFQSGFGGTSPTPVALPGYGDAFVTELPLLPAGVTRYGAPSPPCHGPLYLSVNSQPSGGNPNFEIHAIGAPPNALGALILGVPPTPRVATPILGIDLWLTQLAPITLPGTPNNLGFERFALPIPPGVTWPVVGFQGVWLGGCNGLLVASDALF